MTLANDGTWSPLTFAQVRGGLVALWKASTGFGANADTDGNTGDGLLINMISMLLGQAFDVDTALWDNAYFRSASGQALDRILDLLGKRREPATSSTAVAVFYGSPATVVPILTTVITDDDTANRFATDESTAVGAANNSDTWMIRIIAVEVGVIYTAQVDAEIPSGYTAQLGDTVDDIASELRDDINNDGFATAALAGTDSNGFALIAVDIVGGPGDLTLVGVGESFTVFDGFEAIRSAVTATSTGPLVAAAGTLQNLTNPIVGIEGVTNDADATPGETEESDDEFRARHLQTLFANAARTDSGMRAAVEAIDDMVEVGVTSNRTTSPNDAFGRPIHSVEVVYLAAEGVDVRQQVADAIARQIPAGIEPYGLQSQGLGTTVDGESIEVFATPVTQLYLWLDVTLTAGESFPTAGDVPTAVKNAIAQYFDTGQLSTADGIVTVSGAKLITEKDMVRTATHTPINNVTNNGATVITITSDATPTPAGPPTLVATDQPAGPREIIRADASRITVTVI